MKTFPARLVLALVVVVVGVLTACGAEPVKPAARPGPDVKEFAAVEQFLGLSDAELDQMQQVLARIRAMKPAERAALRAEMDKYRQLPEGQRQQLRQGWGGMPREVQDAWREMMQGATPERRTEIQNRIQSLDPEARLNYRRQLTEEYLKNKAAKP
ncbi:DUF3106 domain-containing protein [Horticoccus sp. 23ND18S-11]|uniref:DUF3106 domain-containing protein n=1 Tax=Horticoccus sp. 23ND18S-11 TaxID=3391832 RepID=UPI0039C920B1